jgi:acetoacetyl-CoA synthetase
MDDFREYINKRHNLQLRTYGDLHSFSVGAHGSTRNAFWTYLWQYLEIKASAQPTIAIDETRNIASFPEFYQDARLNFAENLLSRHGHETAIKVLNEANLDSGPENISWDQLQELVRQLADALSSSGLQKGDVVVVIGGNNKISLALILATASLGGVISSLATDVGEQALLDRLSQLRPQFLFTDAKYRYNGKLHSIIRKVDSVWDKISKPTNAELVITTPHNNEDKSTQLGDFLKRGTGKPLAFLQVPFNTPLCVMFSSGTTGVPKAIVHSHGGVVINLKKEYRLHCNFDGKDVYFHYTNIGWALWNIMLGALFCGSTVVLYDGSPFYPSAELFLQRVISTEVTAFGAGPKYFSELRRMNIHAKYMQNNRLKILLSTGAVLTPALSEWMATSFGPLCQISFSGGTELCGSFVHGTVSLPTYPGEITVKALGIAVDVYSSMSSANPGRPLQTGETGELVCTQPFPNMPLRFLHDPKRERYSKAYFSEIPCIWTHGDRMYISPQTGGIYILGRSDSVLNPAGVRFGSGEIYSIIEKHFAVDIVDSICVGQQRASDETERVILFVVVRSTPGKSISDGEWRNLKGRIKDCIASSLSRRHVPFAILSVSHIPYNANGKKMEIPLKGVLSEGKQAFVKRKFTPDELNALQNYAQYHESLEVTPNQEHHKVTKSKL